MSGMAASRGSCTRWTRRPGVTWGKCRSRSRVGRDEAGSALSAEAVFAKPGVKKRAAKSFRLEQQTGPAAVWQAKVVDVAVGTDRRPRHRLILAPNRQTGEKKYFLTNAPRRIGLRRVLRAAFCAGMWNMCSAWPRAKSA